MHNAVAVAAILSASLGHIFLKKFALRSREPVYKRLFDAHFVLSAAFFVASAGLGMVALMFMEFSVFFSWTALSYIFISVLSRACLGEEIDKRKVLGNLFIIVGILVYNIPAM